MPPPTPMVTIPEPQKTPDASMVELIVPAHLEADVASDIIIKVNNKTDWVVDVVAVDLSDLLDYFKVDKEVLFKRVRPGMEVEKRVAITALQEKGTFPFTITVQVTHIRDIREFKVKVGGTEVY